MWTEFGSEAISAGETRTISLYQVHTGESLTVTYMVNGRYVPSAMKQIKYLLRDWRRNKVITMDPKTIDLVWELHADLGSRVPINIISGYRSAATNAFLKRSGRNVADKSQHILGKAIDINFPDVPTIKVRNSALVRQTGGVGFYPTSGPKGFVHVDSGRVRNWGPGISAREMASIFRDYRKTVGARLNKTDQVLLASAKVEKGKARPSAVSAYDLAEEQMADLSNNASQAPVKPKMKPAVEQTVTPDTAAAVVAETPIIPTPRPKPIEILMAAAMNLKIEPASAPPDEPQKEDSPVADEIGPVIAAASMVEEPSFLSTNGSGKGNFASSLRDGIASSVPTIRGMMTASASESDLASWPSLLTRSMEQEIRLNGAPQPFTDTATAGILPGSAEAAEVHALPQLALATMQEVATGKGDMLVVNRDGKGNFGMMAKPASFLKVGQIYQ